MKSKLPKYFKFVGYLSLFFFSIAAIFYFVVILKATPLLKDSSTAVYWWVSFLAFILMLLIGPASGLLFISYSRQLEKDERRHTQPVVTSESTFNIHDFLKDKEPKETKEENTSTESLNKDDVFENNLGHIDQQSETPSYLKKVLTKNYSGYDTQGNYIEVGKGTEVFVVSQNKKKTKSKIFIELNGTRIGIKDIPESYFLDDKR